MLDLLHHLTFANWCELAQVLIVAGAVPYLRRIGAKTSEIAASVVHLPETLAEHEQRIGAVETKLGIPLPPRAPLRSSSLSPVP